MKGKHAESLAATLGGKVVVTQPGRGVGLVRGDGRYVLIESDAGACYFDEHACWVGYETTGSDPRGDVEAEEWIHWDGSQHWATSLARLIGGKAHAVGGGAWVVLFDRADGRLAVICADAGAVYPDRAAFDADYGEEQVTYLDF